MWIGSMKLTVATMDTTDAGTDSLVTAMIERDGNDVVNLKLDWPTENDLERGAQRDYTYYQLPRHNDQTPVLPDGIGQIPMPYPDFGIEFSNKLPGHLKLGVRIHGDDMWVKDNVDLYITEVRRVATSFDTEAWVEDNDWTYVATWSKDKALSTDSDEGVTLLNLILN
jgi:hypothetical protein